jgi:uncharacterized lipoprotein YbaY
MSNGNQPLKPQKELNNLRQYQSIWNAIKEKQPGQVTEIRCHPSAIKTIIQAVKKEKTGEVAIKKKIAMPAAGPLEISHRLEEIDGKETGKAVISFKLSWDASKL